MKKKHRNRVMVVIPTAWTAYMVDPDIAKTLEEQSERTGAPTLVLLEAMVVVDRAERLASTNLSTSESINLPAEDYDGDSGFLGGPDAFDD